MLKKQLEEKKVKQVKNKIKSYLKYLINLLNNIFIKFKNKKCLE